MEPFCKQLHHVYLTSQLFSLSLHSSHLLPSVLLPLFLRHSRWKSAQFDSAPGAVIKLLMCSFILPRTYLVSVVSSSSFVAAIGLIHLRSRQICSMKSTVAALVVQQLPLDSLRNFGCLGALRLLLRPVL